MKKYIADVITSLRIVCGIALLFPPALSSVFMAFYTAAGVSDMIDGTVARLTHSESGFGSVLDTAADFVFVSCAFVKLLPVLSLPTWALWWTAIIFAVRIFNIACSRMKKGTPVTVHSVSDKVTGALMFALPFALGRLDIGCVSAVVCASASFSSISKTFALWGKRQM